MINSAKKIIKILNNHGYEAYMVGGFVRDYILNIKYNDIDITTNATPDKVMSLFDAVPTGIKFGTVLVLMDGFNFEVTTFRSEGNYVDFRHPSTVRFETELIKDLSRRDFTINALAMDLNNKAIDYYDGIKDLSNKLIKAVGNPYERFKEDALRMLRAFHFVSKLDFEIEENTFNAIVDLKDLIKNVSIERIENELNKIFNGKYKYKALNLLKKSKLLDFLNLDFSYNVDDLTELLIVSYRFNNQINLFKTSNKVKYDVLNGIKLLNEFKEFNRIDYFNYNKLYLKAIKIYELINDKTISLDLSEFIINNMKELNINSKSLSNLNIENKYHGMILKELFNMVLEEKIKNDKIKLEKEAILLYNRCRS